MTVNTHKPWLLRTFCLILSFISGMAFAISYDYDELGRLISVTDDNGDLTVYRYDQSGNLLAVEAPDPADLNIIDFTPKTGSVGTIIYLAGTGFAPALIDNTVYLNGTAAQVLTASPTALSVVIPAGATSGLIQVDTLTGTAFSADSLMVEPDSGLPVIFSISPGCVGAGQTITVDGFYLGSQTQVEVGDFVATASVESEGHLSVVAPASSMGGRVKVTTSSGSAESDQAVAVLASSSACNSFDSARWIDIDTPFVHPGASSGKKVYWYFRGEPDQWLNLQAGGPNTDSSSVFTSIKLYQPGKTQVYSGTLFYAAYTAPFKRITVPGVYQIELGSGAGFDSILETPTPITMDGVATTLVTGRAQRKRLVTPLTTEHGFSLGVESITMAGGASGDIRMLTPDGTVLMPALAGSDGLCSTYGVTPACGISFAPIAVGDPPILEWKPIYTATSTSADLLLTSILIQPLPANQATSLNIQRAGETINYIFQGTADNSYSISMMDLDVGGTETRVRLYLSAPDGSLLSTVSGTTTPIITEPTGTITYQSLPETGQYTLRLVPYAGHTASGTITLDGGTPLESDPIIVTKTAPTNVQFTLDALAGESYGFGFTGLNIQAPTGPQQSFIVKMYTPGGQLMPTLGSGNSQDSCYQTDDPGCEVEFIPMPFDGVYSLIIEPDSSVTSYDFTIQATLDLIEPVEATPYSHMLTEPGQNARLTFDAQPGQAKKIVLTNVMPDPTGKDSDGFVLMPDGGVLGVAPLLPAKFRDFVPDNTISIGDFPISGEYTVVIDPDYAHTVDFTVRQENDVLDPLDGGMTPHTVIAGPWRRAEFYGVAGERWSWAVHNVSLTPPLNANPTVLMVVYDPDNQRVLSSEGLTTTSSCIQDAGSWDCDLDLIALPKTGTYQAVAYLPVDRGADIVTADAIAVRDLVISGTAENMLLSQGQNGFLEFPVVAGKSIQVVVTRNTGIDAGNDLMVWVKDPSGETINQRSMTGTTTVTSFTVTSTPMTGTYQIMIDPDRGRTAAVNVSVQ